jgi:hypothetical protein
LRPASSGLNVTLNAYRTANFPSNKPLEPSNYGYLVLGCPQVPE